MRNEQIQIMKELAAQKQQQHPSMMSKLSKLEKEAHLDLSSEDLANLIKGIDLENDAKDGAGGEEGDPTLKEVKRIDFQKK